jgi:rhodanese-related sulfurtransferase
MNQALISPQDLHDALIATGPSGTREIAPLDLREEGSFGARHLLRAVNLPLSVLELRTRQLVPRLKTPVVLIDDGEGEAARGAALLIQAGYSDVALLEGGLSAWEAAGFAVFSGINVPSKLFGERIEQRFGTPHLDAQAVARMRDAGDDLVILDSRPFSEFRRMNIPSAINLPGAELVARVRAAAPDPKTTVIVNCAGRTRSIIGAQSLINAGLENPVYALKDGTMGWHLAGLALEKGQDRIAPDPTPEARQWGVQAAAQVAQRFQVGTIDADGLARLQADQDRTTFLLDVRAHAEYEAGHMAGAIHAPGGQLVQASDRYVGVLGARLVLVDDEGPRAQMTASWLIHMGWPDVRVMRIEGPLEQGAPEPRVPELFQFAQSFIIAQDLATHEGVPIIDLSTSRQHKHAHIPGARFAIRSRLAQDLGSLKRSKMIVLYARDERLARLAANDLTRIGIHRVRILRGGLAAWQAAGFETQTGMTTPLSPQELDVYQLPYDREEGIEEAMQAYLSWEVDLIRQGERDGTLSFPDFGP